MRAGMKATAAAMATTALGYNSRYFNSIACNSKGFNAVSATAAAKKW
jgi:hypothetical protein